MNPPRDLSRTPLFQVFLNVLNLPSIETEMDGIVIESLNSKEYEAQSKFDLTLYVKESATGIALHLVYNRELFNANRMTLLLDHFQQILQAVTTNPDLLIDEIALAIVSKEHLPDVGSILPVLEQGIPEVQFDSPLVCFQKTRLKRGTSIAVVDKEGQWSYQQIDDASTRVGNALLFSMKSTTGNQSVENSYVAIYAARQAYLVVALLACFKAGVPFVLLDPAYPDIKLAKMYQSINPALWLQLTPDKLPVQLENELKRQSMNSRFTLASNFQGLIEQVELSDDSPLDRSSSQTFNFGGKLSDTAYLSFTSGSTGDPKLIATAINPLSHFLNWYCKEFKFDHHDRFSMLSGLGHDPLLRDIFTPLSVGASLYIPSGESLLDSGGLAQWFITSDITVTHLTPSIAHLLLDTVTNLQSDSLRLVCYGGEELKQSDVDQLRSFAPNAQATNFYGATETPQVMAYKDIHPDGEEGIITLGKGIEGVDILVLDSDQNLTAISEVGEICIRTPYLSKGYLNDLVLTKARFRTVNWSGEEERIYYTGDLGRYCINGDIDLLGRSDSQVKVRGYRVELGEIEEALTTIAWVQQAWVLVQDSDLVIAYLVAPAKDVGQVDATQIDILRSALSDLLPIYMIPLAYVVVERIPLTPSGKINKALLPQVDPSNLSGIEYVEPISDVEKSIASMWQNILKAEPVGLKDNFFHLGGHSLLATKVVARIKTQYGIELPLRSLFEEPTLGNLTKYVETALWLREAEVSEEDGDREEFEL
ncbi:MAG: AMP-binding protein [Pseudomonadales bacterium]|nr:AMP-binding protein [Pseudomonadales bacterium]